MLADVRHGTIGTVTAAIEEGLVVPREQGRIAIEAPAGRVSIEYKKKGQYVEQVRLFNVASYLHASNALIDVPGLGSLTIDLAYGGNYYAIIEPQTNWAGLDTMSIDDIVRVSPLVRRAAERVLAPVHPEDDRIRGVSHVMWCDAPKTVGADAATRCSTGNKAIDRSPCGRLLSADGTACCQGRLQIGDTFVHESIIDTLFNCRWKERLGWERIRRSCRASPAGRA
jgi:proline racemase